MYKTYQLKIKNNKQFLGKMFLEAKWLTNYIIQNNGINFNAENEFVQVKTKDGEFQKRKITSLNEIVRRGIYVRYKNDIESLEKRRLNKQNVGTIKYKKDIKSIPYPKSLITLKEGTVKFKGFRKSFKVFGFNQIPINGAIESIELIKNSFGFYMNVCVFLKTKANVNKVKIKKGRVGVDFGVKDTFSFSEGTKINFNCQGQVDKIKKHTKSLSKKKVGSKNWIKQKRILNRSYEKYKRIKIDAKSKLIKALKPFIVAFQDDNISKWFPKYGKKIQHSILGRVKSALKSNPDNRMLNRFVSTTKTCFDCSKINSHKLNDRIYSCECGYSFDRDIHAARNMLKLLGMGQAGVKMVSDLRESLNNIQCKHLSVKHEALYVE